MQHQLVQGHRSHHVSWHPQAACHGHPLPSRWVAPGCSQLDHRCVSRCASRDRGVQRAPAPARLAVADLFQERIKRRPVLGGFINEYERAA
jgi:hypothetical protein